MKNLETGLDYAKFDHSDTRIRQAQYRHEPGWRGAWVWCLRHQDYEAAELIASRNLISDECASGAHDDCHFHWCPCPHHSAVQFELEHAHIPLHQPIAVDDDEDREAA